MASIETAEQRKSRICAGYADRYEHLVSNFKRSHASRELALTFNGSLTASAQILNPNARKTPERRRVQAGFELLVNAAALALARERDRAADFPTQGDVREAASRLVPKLKKDRGRPADLLLAHHVRAFMALYRQTFGEDLRVSKKRKNEYDPRIKSILAELFLSDLRQVDPGITMITLVEAIIRERRTRSTVGKRFEDYFPFYGGSIDPATGCPLPGPRFRLERFDRVIPIYSSEADSNIV